MKSTLLFIFILLITAMAQGAAVKRTQKLFLGETEVKINVYENAGAQITFFAPHYNEQIAVKLAKEAVERYGGRVVEIESSDEKGKPSRYLKFKFGGKSYTIDPNRIYTENGRNCGAATEIEAVVKIFADDLLRMLLAPDGRSLKEGERFLVAVHNNSDVDAKAVDKKSGDLTAVAFINISMSESLADGAYKDQAEGVYLSNTEEDVDNFIFLSTPAYVGYFAEKGFNIVVQKSVVRLQSKKCTVDDGSLSIFAARESIPYINLEADGVNGRVRQRQMLEAVYELLQTEIPVKSEAIAVRK